MENRDRDRVTPDDLNRNQDDDSTADFGEKIGQSEDMNEPNRRSGIVDGDGIEGGNIGDNISARDSGRRSGRSKETEH